MSGATAFVCKSCLFGRFRKSERKQDAFACRFFLHLVGRRAQVEVAVLSWLGDRVAKEQQRTSWHIADSGAELRTEA